MTEGWVQLHRGITEWEWYSDINVCRLFIHLLMKANHRDIKWQGKLIKRGESLTSLNTLSRETGLTVKQVRVALDKLKRTGEVAVSRGHNYQVISITNYDDYQSEGRQSGNQRAGQGQAEGSQRATNNNENNEINNKKKARVSLEELSTFHVRDWLEKKRSEGKYVNYDEEEVLEYFKNYCISKGRKYENYVRAYQNAFGWDRFEKKWGQREEKLSKHERAKRALGLA